MRYAHSLYAVITEFLRQQQLSYYPITSSYMNTTKPGKLFDIKI